MMTYTLLQKTSLSLILLSLSTDALAISPDPISVSTSAGAAVTSSPSTNPQSNAIEFAKQAAAIAGAAQACGQNTSDFSARVREAINKLTSDPTEQAASLLIYQQLAQATQSAESKNQTIPCTQVAQDFLKLPIMQPDYKTAVIDKLNSASK